MADLDDLFAPAEEIPDNAIPPHFEEAMVLIQDLNSRCQQAKIPEATQVSALLVELMPRLVRAYGPDGVMAVLSQLITEIAGTQLSSDTNEDGTMPSPDTSFPN